MPEAAVNKDHGFVFGEYNVRFTWKRFYIQAVTKTIGKEKLTHQYLRLGILAFDTAHVEAASWTIVNIGHTQI